MNPPDRLNELLESWCDGLITPEMESELDRLIASDTTAARRAAVYFDLHRMLHERANPNGKLLPSDKILDRVQPRDTAQRDGPNARTGSQRFAKASSRKRTIRPQRYSSIILLSSFILLAMVGVVVVLNQAPQTPQVQKQREMSVWLEGQAKIANRDGPVSDNQVSPGSHLIAGLSAVLCYADGTRLLLKPDSSLSLSEQNEKQVYLTSGVIDAQVARQPQGSPFRINTANAELVVVGTEFRVIAEPERTVLTVEKGVVQFISAGINELVTAGGQQTSHQRQVLISSNAIWSYRDDGVVPNKDWLTSGFDDTSWGHGKATLGFNPDSPKRTKTYTTIIGKAHAEYRVPLVTYFRHEFTLTSTIGLRRLVAHLRRDNGAVLYLNGIELGRDGMPTGPINARTPALDDAKDYDDSIHTMVFSSDALRVGVNCLAVQVHQKDSYSSDILFALELVAESTDKNSNINNP